MAGTHGHTCSHHSAAGMSEIKLKLSMLLTFSFVVIEMIAGTRANSLALVSDAGHNFTDGLALALSWYALWVARKPATPTRTYGYHRVGILTALFNAVTLLVIAVFIFIEAFQLFRHPAAVASLPMMAVASIGLLMNTAIAVGIRGEAAHNVNMRSAFIHMAGDALASLGVVLAGLCIHYTGWLYADPLVSVLIGLFIVYSSWGIVVETLNVLLEGTPRGLDVHAMASAMAAVPGVMDVHDLHVWTIADGMNALSCHLRVDETDMRITARVVQEVKSVLIADYAVGHATIETECSGCNSLELYCRLGIHGDHNHNHDHDHDHADCAHDHAH
jgi:cobalt-zinc-cadmium efflux system protein